MKKNMHRRVALVAVAFSAGCSGGKVDRTADTNTSWVERCESSDECGSGSCVANVCVPEAVNGPSAPAALEDWNVALSASGDQAGTPSLRWLEDRFVAAWLGSPIEGGAQHLARAEIQPDGEFSVSRVPYTGRSAVEPVLAPDGEIAVSAFSTYAHECAITTFDADLGLLGTVEVGCGNDAPVAPLGAGQWVVAHGSYIDSESQAVVVERFDPRAAAPLSDAVPVGVTHGDQSLALFAVGDAAAVVWPTGGGTAHTLVGLQGPGSSPASQKTVAGNSLLFSNGFGSARIDGQELLFGTDGTHLWVADLTQGGDPVASAALVSTGVADRGVGTAVASELGLVGVCYGTGPGPAGGSAQDQDGVSFIAVDSEGAVVSGPTVIETGFYNIGGCSVAWSGEEFVVAYWKIDLPNSVSELRARRIVP